MEISTARLKYDLSGIGRSEVIMGPPSREFLSHVSRGSPGFLLSKLTGDRENQDDLRDRLGVPNEPVLLPAGYQPTPENGQHPVCRQQFAAGFVFRTFALGSPEIGRKNSRKMGGKPIEENPNPNFYVAHPPG